MEDFDLNNALRSFSSPTVVDHDANKENVPSLRTVSSIVKKKKKKMKRKDKIVGRKIRIPLEDITSLFANIEKSDEVSVVGRRVGAFSALIRTSILLRRDFR